MKYTYTTQKQVRKAFWSERRGLPGISPRRIKSYSGNGTMHNTDTRCAFVQYIDSLYRDGRIPHGLAERVTL